jgi:hypothetical protein
MDVSLPTLDPVEFALRCAASEGEAAYLLYVVPSDQSAELIEEVSNELPAMGIDVRVMGPLATDVLEQVAKAGEGEALLLDATRYGKDDWSLLDRRRSSLQRSGTTALITTPESFADAMRFAPNLMSWLGAEVFASPDPKAVAAEHARDGQLRLEALRRWSGLTDEVVLEAAAAKTLPRDPEYAEWLVLLGRGDLLDD